MKVLTTFCMLAAMLFGGIDALAQGYIESQMQYKMNSDGSKAFSARWDEDDLTMFVDMELTWLNYRSDWHASGFRLSKSYTARVAFPQLAECGLAQFKGEFKGEQDQSHNRLSLIFKGPDCRYLRDDFALSGVSIVFYEVPSWDGVAPRSSVMRIQIFDQIEP